MPDLPCLFSEKRLDTCRRARKVLLGWPFFFASDWQKKQNFDGMPREMMHWMMKFIHICMENKKTFSLYFDTSKRFIAVCFSLNWCSFHLPYINLLTLRRPYLFDVCSENKGCCVPPKNTVSIVELDRVRHSRDRHSLYYCFWIYNISFLVVFIISSRDISCSKGCNHHHHHLNFFVINL